MDGSDRKYNTETHKHPPNAHLRFFSELDTLSNMVTEHILTY